MASAGRSLQYLTGEASLRGVVWLAEIGDVGAMTLCSPVGNTHEQNTKFTDGTKDSVDRLFAVAHHCES